MAKKKMRKISEKARGKISKKSKSNKTEKTNVMEEDEEEKELRIQRPMGQRITSRLSSPEDVGNTPISAIMRRGVIVLDSSRSVLDAARIMKRNFIGSVIVMEKGKAVGIITERDIVRDTVAEKRNPATTKLGKAMSTPIRVVLENQSVQEVISVMRKYRIKKLPVLDSQKRLVGIVTESDIARAAPGLLDLAMEITNITRLEAETLGAGRLSEEEQEEEYGRYGEGTEGHKETE